MTDKEDSPAIIGWKEMVHFPGWGVRNVLAKADSGAKGTAVDARAIERVDGDRVRFQLAFDRRTQCAGPWVEASILGTSVVRSSNGSVQERFTVEQRIRVGLVQRTVVINLMDRTGMICRVLLGRNFLAGRFLVDSDAKYLHGPRKLPRKLV